jgi:acetyl-CoA/propionyl-CoA carboxylase biotin carboxyl carrier protein
MPTVLPFHRAGVDDPAFAGDRLDVHTRWIETEFTADLAPQETAVTVNGPGRERLTVEVGGKRLEVVVPALLSVPAAGDSGASAQERSRGSRGAARRSGRPAGGAGGDSLVTPMQGTIVKVVAAEGQQVTAGETVVILEAMKMEQPLAAHKNGTVTGLAVEVGQTVAADTEICQIKD